MVYNEGGDYMFKFKKETVEKFKKFYSDPNNIKMMRLGTALYFLQQREILKETYTEEEIRKRLET